MKTFKQWTQQADRLRYLYTLTQRVTLKIGINTTKRYGKGTHLGNNRQLGYYASKVVDTFTNTVVKDRQCKPSPENANPATPTSLTKEKSER